MIHQFKNNGYNIVIDINSGAIHVVDELVYDFLDIWQKKGREAAFEEMKATHQDTEEAVLLQCQSEIDTLIEEGSLFTEDNYEPRIIDFTKRSTVVKAMCLHIAHDCNLACKYCFAEEGEYHGGKRELMSLEVGKAALDFLVANSGTRRNLEVDFFGGEPTMNWQVVKDLVAYGRSLEEANNKNFRFTLTTNGVLLNEEIQEFANKEMANVVLSCDGRPEIHNLMRPFRKGAPSYEVVMPKFKELANSRGQDKYYIRGTFTRNNLDFSKDVLHLADEGFKQISVEPVVAQETDDYALKAEDLPQLFEEYDALCAEMMKRQGTDKD
ncbi:MAG: thioether cross-link-forming SCIFF peptide maturase, partial [Pseudobutyrivibrio sp.]|nr:thioether cross-link-forming SCIFF peptide maturase [Pseudobutyrivibrio sp.]